MNKLLLITFASALTLTGCAGGYITGTHNLDDRNTVPEVTCVNDNYGVANYYHYQHQHPESANDPSVLLAESLQPTVP